jgi:hypothetical protein
MCQLSNLINSAHSAAKKGDFVQALFGGAVKDPDSIVRYLKHVGIFPRSPNARPAENLLCAI